nr:hypothetical protein BaRGS_019304 [Batillaria attramentaria]
MDGFRWDYIKKVSGLGNFTRLRTSGVTVDYVNPGFATKTFPSHYSIVTGLYEEDHGIVGNNMWDPERNAAFDKYSTESFWWDEGEPVWVTAVRQNKRAGVYYWPGTGAEIRGYRPTVWIPWLYTQTAPFPDRVQTALRWFTDNNTDLVLLHFHEPDSTGHVYGPDSSELADKVREMDAVLGLILNGLETRGLDDVVNVIVTSDHGMAYVDMPNNLIDLWAVIDPTMVDRVAESGTLTAILPAEGREEDVVKALKNNSHVTVYRKEEIPEHFHYKHNPRIMPVIMQAQEGWILSALSQLNKSVEEMRGEIFCLRKENDELKKDLEHFRKLGGVNL